MTTTHPQQQWFAGDDWQIDATLLDEDGAPFNLAGTHQILWTLLDPAGRRALDESDVNITVTNAIQGECAIHIPAAKTSPLASGPYSDVIRLNMGGITSTLSIGPILVTADPWLAPVGIAATQRQAKLRVA